MSAERQLEERWPEIEWQKPMLVTARDTTRFCCRYCISLYGLKATDVASGDTGFDTSEAAVEHIVATHGVRA